MRRIAFPEAQLALEEAQAFIKNSLNDLAHYNLLNKQNVKTVLTRINPVASVAEALEGAIYVQENTAEVLDVKKVVYSELDNLASPETVIGSSTSGLMASLFTEKLRGRNRCLVAHPINPPYLVPAVEPCPAPWTDAAAYRARLTVFCGLADIIKVSDEDLDWLAPGPAPLLQKLHKLQAGRPKVMILTRGKDGATALLPDGSKVSVAAQRAEVVDTVGAGDTFNAGVLAELQERSLLDKSALATITAAPIRAALAFGSKVATVTVSRAGANPPWRAEMADG